MNAVLVTIVIPTYNDDPNHLAEAVASAKAQTYPNLEIVVVDDGSDPAVELDGVRVIRQTNAGPAAARNKGITATNGEVVICLDADDQLSPTYAAEAVEALTDPSATVAYARMEPFGDHPGGVWPTRGRLTLEDFSQRSAIPVPAAFRRADSVRAGGWDETMRIGMEDHEWWVRLLGTTGGVAAPMPSAVAHCRVRPGSRSRSQSYAGALAITRTRMLASNDPATVTMLLSGAWAYADHLERELERTKRDRLNVRFWVTRVRRLPRRVGQAVRRRRPAG